MTTFIVFVVALSILVFVHEWGHFIVAKKSGVRVDIFSIGFGPKIFGFTWGGTEYRIAPFPFGGFVKIYGQDPLEEAEGDVVKAEEIARDPQSFHSKPLYKKLAVVFAGPIMNLILCFVIMPLAFMVGRMQPKILDEKPVVIDVTRGSPAEQVGLKKGDLILSLNQNQLPTWKDLITQVSLYPEETVALKIVRDGVEQDKNVFLIKNKNLKQTAGYLGIEPFEFYGNEPVIDSVRPGSAAEKAGILAGDKFIAIEGKPIQYWTEITQAIQNSNGKALQITVERKATQVQLVATAELDEASKTWLLGMTKHVNPDDYAKKKYGFVDSVRLGFAEAGKLLSLTFDILKRLFSAKLSLNTLGGPLQIAQATSAAAKSGLGEFIYLLAFLSVQLGIMNLLPVPVLDGGHVVFMLIEGVRGKPLSPKVRAISMQVGLFMLLGLMLFVTFNDVQNLWGFGNIFNGIRGLF